MSLGQRSRLGNVGLLVACTAVLAVARWLEPAAAGHGTHRALGLPPCTFFSLTGRPCPMCGATTTFALLAEGRVVEGVVNQPFAALLFLLVVGVAGVAGAEVVAPRARWDRIDALVAGREGWLAGATLAMMVASWAWKLVFLM
ncbi:MAG: DUF2752 domain-containing protein [Alphaproteobacteria bacterium]|nr:DUF2752 domain-containing protein [Alphaproteobacteria bacterium]